jgi:ADP-heptose:LPS heptosyltransferase
MQAMQQANPPEKILIVQTAFIGDVILATALIEKLHQAQPQAQLDFLLRKGNEHLLTAHPHLHRIWVFDKKGNKYLNLWQLILQLRKEKYDQLITVQRFATIGLLTLLAGARQTTGFDKNPFSRFFSRRVWHTFHGKHEIERNQQLIAHLSDAQPALPKLYPSQEDFQHIARYQQGTYICIAPASVWFTKQFPVQQWLAFLSCLPPFLQVYLLGGSSDLSLCQQLASQSRHKRIQVLAGELSLLASAALMRGAVMNFVNDSAPLHLASALDAPTCAVYCSTVPRFGFGPLASQSYIVQLEEELYCRPCGIHGYKACPEGHFRCGHDIRLTQLQQVLYKALNPS